MSSLSPLRGLIIVLFPYISTSLLYSSSLISLFPHYISISLYLSLLIIFLFPYTSISLLYFYFLTSLSPYYIPISIYLYLRIIFLFHYISLTVVGMGIVIYLYLRHMSLSLCLSLSLSRSCGGKPASGGPVEWVCVVAYPWPPPQTLRLKYKTGQLSWQSPRGLC